MYNLWTCRFLVYKRCLRSVQLTFASFGVDISKLISAFRGYPIYFKNLLKLKKSIRFSQRNLAPACPPRFGMPFPVVDEFFSSAGTASGHYFHQDLFVANQIYRSRPDLHLDIGSRVDGFVAHLLSFEQRVLLGDVRSIEIKNPNISFVLMDLTSEINSSMVGKYSSISCLHAIEHMGLGRYGDPVNVLGHYKALQHLSQLLSGDGILYLSYPAGAESRIEYNAHRVISFAESRYMFNVNGLDVKGFAYVDDAGDFFRVEELDSIDWEFGYGMNCGCAIWTLQKC